MNAFLRANVRRLDTGAFWMAVLLVLPACGLDSTGAPLGSPGSNVSKGASPHTDLIFCDIERSDIDGLPARHCATDEELDPAINAQIRLSEAAIALVEGRTSPFALDDSEAALERCNGVPEAVYFQGPFPQGLAICLNCGEAVGAPSQPDVTAICLKQCLDFFGTTSNDGTFFPDTSPDPANVDFCSAASKPSTNTANDTCFIGGCDAGSVSPAFEDPRKTAEPVAWADLLGVAPGGAENNDLTRTAATTELFDAGAVSVPEQWIKGGDAYVEFSASSTNKTHLLGLSSIPGCAAPCHDADPGITSIGFLLGLGNDSQVYILESGNRQSNPVTGDFTWGTYSVGERFRIRVLDNGNGTASISHARVVGTCLANTPCAQDHIFTHVATASYPMRVDTSSFEQDATLVDVRIVRIK